jgi:hypothetical protein
MRVWKKCHVTLVVLEAVLAVVVEPVLTVAQIVVLVVALAHAKEDVHILALMDVKEVAVVTNIL